MVPHTKDGRVMFAIPWHGHTLVGTTDTPMKKASLEPVAMDQEIEFMLETAALYLAKSRPRPTSSASSPAFVRWSNRATARTPRRFRAITPSTSTRAACSASPAASGRPIATWRRTRQPGRHAGRSARQGCVTKTLNIHGYHANAAKFGPLSFYGTDAPAIRKLIDEDAALGRATRCRTALRRSGGRLGRARGNGPHGGGRSRPPHPRLVSQLQGRPPHGPARRRHFGQGTQTASGYQVKV
jgi:glycerol-3-phosphate dehydrogenase